MRSEVVSQETIQEKLERAGYTDEIRCIACHEPCAVPGEVLSIVWDPKELIDPVVVGLHAKSPCLRKAMEIAEVLTNMRALLGK